MSHQPGNYGVFNNFYRKEPGSEVQTQPSTPQNLGSQCHGLGSFPEQQGRHKNGLTGRRLE